MQEKYLLECNLNASTLLRKLHACMSKECSVGVFEIRKKALDCLYDTSDEDGEHELYDCHEDNLTLIVSKKRLAFQNLLSENPKSFFIK